MSDEEKVVEINSKEKKEKKDSKGYVRKNTGDLILRLVKVRGAEVATRQSTQTLLTVLVTYLFQLEEEMTSLDEEEIRMNLRIARKICLNEFEGISTKEEFKVFEQAPMMYLLSSKDDKGNFIQRTPPKGSNIVKENKRKMEEAKAKEKEVQEKDMAHGDDENKTTPKRVN